MIIIILNLSHGLKTNSFLPYKLSWFKQKFSSDNGLKKEKDICNMQHIKDIPSKQLSAGINGHYAHGDSMTLGYVEIIAGSILAEHRHVHEQITYIIEGQLDMVIGGKACSLTAGMYHVIPSNTLHSAIAKTDCKVIDVFNPVREDYKSL